MYAVQFDKTFETGNLAGITIPGQVVRYPTRACAERAHLFYTSVEVDGDFMRDAVTGARYRVSNVGLYLA